MLGVGVLPAEDDIDIYTFFAFSLRLSNIDHKRRKSWEDQKIVPIRKKEKLEEY
jgi:hypothetical protein